MARLLIFVVGGHLDSVGGHRLLLHVLPASRNSNRTTRAVAGKVGTAEQVFSIPKLQNLGFPRGLIDWLKNRLGQEHDDDTLPDPSKINIAEDEHTTGSHVISDPPSQEARQ
jgi:hypothetical protein